jgi:hypothetical protein
MSELYVKDHSTKVWSKLAQWFLSRRLKCEKLTTDDDRRNLMAKAKKSYDVVYKKNKVTI